MDLQMIVSHIIIHLFNITRIYLCVKQNEGVIKLTHLQEALDFNNLFY